MSERPVLLEPSDLRLVPDTTQCASCALPVGFYISYDPHRDREISRYRHCLAYPTHPSAIFCEDCIDDWELLLWDGSLSVNVTLESDGMFHASLATYGPDHGMTWEKELEPRHTLGGAVAFARQTIKEYTT